MLKMMTIISPFLCLFQEVISVKGIALWLKSLIRERIAHPKMKIVQFTHLLVSN